VPSTPVSALASLRGAFRDAPHAARLARRDDLVFPAAVGGKKKVEPATTPPLARTEPLRRTRDPEPLQRSTARKRKSIDATVRAVRFAMEDAEDDVEKTSRRIPGGGYTDDELENIRRENPTAYKRIMGNRRSAANHKARRDALMHALRSENARLKEENERLVRRLETGTE
jgi:hypothetical protein